MATHSVSGLLVLSAVGGVAADCANGADKYPTGGSRCFSQFSPFHPAGCDLNSGCPLPAGQGAEDWQVMMAGVTITTTDETNMFMKQGMTWEECRKIALRIHNDYLPENGGDGCAFFGRWGDDCVIHSSITNTRDEPGATYGNIYDESHDAYCPVPPAVDCEMTPFSDYGECSATCGEGTQTRSRSVKQQPENDGQACPTDLEETQACPDLPECGNSGASMAAGTFGGILVLLAAAFAL